MKIKVDIDKVINEMLKSNYGLCPYFQNGWVDISCSLMFNCHKKFVFYEFIQSFKISGHMLMLGTHMQYKKMGGK